MKTINLIYDEKELQEIRTKGEEHDRLCWWFGDKAIESWNRIQGLKSKIINDDFVIGLEETVQIKTLATNQQDIFNQLGDEAGKSGRTIRYYYDLARFYIGDIRGLYDPLPLSHFEFAMNFPSHAEDILEFSLRAMDGNGGKPRSKNYLIANLSKIITDENLLRELGLVQDIESTVEYGDYHETVQQQPQEEGDRIHPTAFHFLQKFKKTTEFWRVGIRKWNIPDERKNKLIKKIRELEEEINLLAAGVEKENN